MATAQESINERSAFRIEFTVDEIAEALRLRRTPISRIFLAFAAVPLLLCGIAFGLLLQQSTGSTVVAVALLVVPSICGWWLIRTLNRRSLMSEAADLLRNGDQQFGPMLVSIGPQGIRRADQDSASLLPWNAFDHWVDGEAVLIASVSDFDVTIPKRCLSASMFAEVQASLDRGCSASALPDEHGSVAGVLAGAEGVIRCMKTPARAARAAKFEAGQVSWPRVILFYFVPAVGIETAIGLDDPRILSIFVVSAVLLAVVIRQPLLRLRARRRIGSLSLAERSFDVAVGEVGFTHIDARGVERWVDWKEIVRWSDEGDLLFVRTSGGRTYWFPIGVFPDDAAQMMRLGIAGGGGLRLERSRREHVRLLSPHYPVWR